MKHKRHIIKQNHHARFTSPKKLKYFEEQDKALLEREQLLDDKERMLKTNMNLLEDTLHEIRKINNQIKSNVYHLNNAIQDLYFEDEDLAKFVNNTLKTIEGNSTLLSIRMNAFDILFDPASASKELELMIGVYSKVEKVYKCLYPSKKKKNLEIFLNGGSNKEFRLRSSIEIAFFIIIENAIKYSPEGEKIDIFFYETQNGLNVKFCNWAICPKEEEFERLTERGFRSNNVANIKEYEGRGIGLYLMKEICETNNVGYLLNKEQNTKNIFGTNYHQFVVTLYFYD